METIIRMQLAEPPVKDGASVAFTKQHANLSNSDKLKAGIDTDRKIATMERDYFLLDGSFSFFRHDRAECGFAARDNSDENGNYANFGDGGTIDITFASARKMGRVTVEGSRETGDFTSRFVVVYYRGATEATRFTITAADVVRTFDFTASGITRMVIAPMAASRPYRRARITNIYFDDMIEFRGADVQSAKALKECSLTGAELPYGTFDATVVSNESATFDVADAGSVYGQLRERMRMDIYFSSDIGIEKIGRYYLTEWKTESPYKLKIQACDLIGLLDDIPYSGDKWLSHSPDSLKSVIQRVLRGIALWDQDIRVQSGFTPPTISGYIKPGTTREALQQALFAGGACFTLDDDGGLTLVPQAISDTAMAPAFDFGSNQKGLNDQSLDIRPNVTAVEVYSRVDFPEARSEIAKFDTLEAGEHELTFDVPTHELQATGATVSFWEPFSAKIIPDGTGAVTVTGIKYAESITIKKADIGNAAAKPNVLKTDGATLINPGNAETVMARLLTYATQKCIQTWRAYNPAFKDINKRVTVATINGKKFNGVVSRVSIDLAGGGICDFEATGFVGDYSATGTKKITFGPEGIVSPATFAYPSTSPQSFIAQLKSAYLATHGITVTIDGTVTRYTESPVTFSLPAATANTVVSVAFPLISKAITIGNGVTCTPERFRFPVADAQYFTVTRNDYRYYVRININGVGMNYDADTKVFALTNTTEATTVEVSAQLKQRKDATVIGWNDPWGGTSHNPVGFYYPVEPAQWLTIAAPSFPTGEIFNGMPVTRIGKLDARWYVNGVLRATHIGVEYSDFSISNTSETTDVRVEVSNIQGESGGGGGSGGGSGYNEWTGMIQSGGMGGVILRDGPNNGNFIASLYGGETVKVIGEATGTAVNGNSKWYNVRVVVSINNPGVIGLVGWVWSGAVRRIG